MSEKTGWDKLKNEGCVVGILKLCWGLFSLGVLVWWGRELVIELGVSEQSAEILFEERWLDLALGMYVFNLVVNFCLNLFAESIRGLFGSMAGITFPMQVWNIFKKTIGDLVFGLVIFFVLYYNSLGLARLFRRMFM